MWILFAFGSALFAGLTSVLAKCGIKKTDSDAATAIRTIVVLIFSWLMVWIVGSAPTITGLDAKTWIFLILSGIATGASWLCYFRALQLGDVNKVVPIDKSSTILTIILALIFLGEPISWLKAAAVVLIGIGTFISKALAMTGLTFPIYIGAMIAAACMRNIGEFTHKFTTHMGEINDIGGISLSLFLGIAMITLKLWQLAALALPLIILLAGQTLLIFLFTYFVIFNIMGRDYDAAVIAAGVCGFGMGATPNAMANMQALCEKYAPSVKAYLLIPLVGSLFADFLNSLVITFFINFI